MTTTSIDLAVIGAGPVGLALALLAARQLPHANITLFDRRDPADDGATDARTLALSLGSVQLLQRLRVWEHCGAEPIREVHVSQLAPLKAPVLADATVRFRAADEAVPMLGAVLHYGQLLAPLQQAWADEVGAAPRRLASRFGTPVRTLKQLTAGVEVDATVAERFDLAVVGEGGVYAEQSRKGLSRDYGQTAWVGTAMVEGLARGLAIERFTPHGPLALLPLPLPGPVDGATRPAAAVWCVEAATDPVRPLDDAQRAALMNTLLPPDAGRIVTLSPLRDFALGLNAERTLTAGRTVRIGNAAQTLHPVAGQGLNLGLRDAFELVQALRAGTDVDRALRRVEWGRAADRWSMIAATDLLARGFTWNGRGMATARALALAALQAATPLKSQLARRMMFGTR